MYDIAEENRRSVPPAVPPAKRWMHRSVLPPMQSFAAGCWNWTPTALPIPFCSTQPLGAKPTLPPWLPRPHGRARRWPTRCAARAFPLPQPCRARTAGRWDSTVSARLCWNALPFLQPEQLDLVLVPCTAFDAGCYRVGMGKGYYDRYLPYCTRAVKIGIALEVQRVPAPPWTPTTSGWTPL